MGKRIKITKSKNSESFYIIDDYTDPKTKKRSTFVVERLGSLTSLKSKFDTDSRDAVIAILKQYVDKLRNQDITDKASVPILFSLGIKDICQQISCCHRFRYDLSSIICDLVTTRIIYPGSKRSSFKDAHHLSTA